MSEYIKREDAIKAVIDFITRSDADKRAIAEMVLADVTSAVVIEKSVILATADEQEKQGFIQTAKVLREMVK